MELQPLLRHLRLRAVARHENLTFAPVLGPDPVTGELLLPDEALHTGYFVVTDSQRRR